MVYVTVVGCTLETVTVRVSSTTEITAVGKTPVETLNVVYPCSVVVTVTVLVCWEVPVDLMIVVIV